MSNETIKDTSKESQQLAFFSLLPITPKDRAYGPVAFTFVSFSIFVCTWCFLIGGALGDFVNASTAIGVTTFGYLAGFVVMILSLMMCYHYGIDPYVAARPIFGHRGAFLVLIMAMVVGLGWIVLITAMFGSGIVRIFTSIDPVWTGAVSGGVYLAAVLFFIGLVWFITWKGPLVVRWTNFIVAPMIMIVLLVMFYIIFMNTTWQEFIRIPPAYSFEWFQRDQATGLELILGVVWSWWPYAGVWMRLAESARIAFYGTLYGTGGGGVIAGLLATFSALWVGEVDPTAWMILVGGATLGAIGLVWVAAANIMSAVGQLYPVALASQHWKAMTRIKWMYVVAVVSVPLLVVTIFDADVLFASVGNWILICGLFFCPTAAIYLVDFWVLRSRKISIRDIYLERKGKYWFAGGFNPAAIIAFFLGFFVYLAFMNPITVESLVEPIFIWTLATPPVLIITGFAYYVMMRFWIIPKGLGGYPEHEEEETTVGASSN